MEATTQESTASEDETHIMLSLDSRLSQLNRAFHDDVDNSGSCRLAARAERRLETHRILVDRRSLEAAPINDKLSARGAQRAEFRPLTSDAQTPIDSAALAAVLESDGRASSRELATSSQRQMLLVLAKTEAWQNYCDALVHYLDRLALRLPAENNDVVDSGQDVLAFSSVKNGPAVRRNNCPVHLHFILDRILAADAALARSNLRVVQPTQRWGQLRMSLFFDAAICTNSNGPVDQDLPQEPPPLDSERNSISAFCHVRRSVVTTIPYTS